MDDESDAEMPGLKLKLNLMRIVSYFIVQVSMGVSFVKVYYKWTESESEYVCDKKLLSGCSSHLASLKKP